MNIAIPAVALCLLLAGPAWSAGSHDHKPVHGGIVAETKDMDLELVAKSDLLQIYLRDHGKSVDISKATAKVTLLLGAEKQEVTLQPAGNRLEAKGQFKVSAGTKVVVQISVAGKPSSARFVLK